MNFSPRPYQATAIARMVEQPYQLLALRMGTGKTVCALTAIQELTHDRFEITKTLVVAPKRVAELVWHAEAAKWTHLSSLRVQRVLGPFRARQEALLQPADIYVINRENFAWLVEQCGSKWPFDCVVIDENRGFKDRSSQAWKALKKVRRSITKLFILTGTPAPNSYLELWPQISILDEGQRLGTGITKYRDRWFIPDKRSQMIVYSWKLKPGAKEEIEEAVKDVMLSIDGELELPERIDNVVPVAIDMDRYQDLEANLVSGSVTAVNAAVLAGKLAQLANGAVYDDSGEVEYVHKDKLEALGEILEQGEPVLCFTTFRHDQQRIMASFPQARVFDGEATLTAWQRGEIELLLMHPASGGHGVDGLQLGGAVAVWFGLPFSLDLYEQANARLHRSGQRSSVVVHHLVAQGTIDERIMAVLASKGDLQQALLEAVKEAATRG
ncbi:MAG: DEAD/DEAH box helicase [Betaproteobacteria bacterium]|nr:DEAD/DEAH box helicase [Betaproteobacteria bacterium]